MQLSTRKEMTMRARLFSASLAAVALAASTGTAVLASGPATATAVTATPQTVPSLTCAPGFELVCTVLGLTVCRHGCAAAPSSAAARTAVTLPPGDLCTVKVDPNPFCLI
jgi:hypothetical protein